MKIAPFFGNRFDLMFYCTLMRFSLVVLNEVTHYTSLQCIIQGVVVDGALLHNFYRGRTIQGGVLIEESALNCIF